MLVAAIMGQRGLNTLLVASQVILSFVLPFIAFPLVYITSSKKLMTVRNRREDDLALADMRSDASSVSSVSTLTQDMEEHDFSNGTIIMCLGYAIWFLVLLANGYVLVTLAMGKGS